jgi:hypothetical protein
MYCLLPRPIAPIKSATLHKTEINLCLIGVIYPENSDIGLSQRIQSIAATV